MSVAALSKHNITPKFLEDKPEFVDVAQEILDFIKEASGGEISVDSVAAKCADSSIADDLKYIISTAEKISGGKYKIKYTPSLVRGQGYYTGVVFEIASPAFSGAVGGGGRYDNLVAAFGPPARPALRRWGRDLPLAAKWAKPGAVRNSPATSNTLHAKHLQGMTCQACPEVIQYRL